MKTTKELKPGEVIFDIDDYQVTRYKYLCVHPTGDEKYHILINMCEEPFRIYEENLQRILDMDLNTYAEAALELAARLEMKAKMLRSKYSLLIPKNN